jgi:hypothetical protein
MVEPVSSAFATGASVEIIVVEVLVGGLEHIFYIFPFSWEYSSQLTNSYFSEG